MIQVYFIIGCVIGGIFAFGVVVLATMDNKELMKIVSKYGDGYAATMLTIAVMANIIMWPVVVIFVINRKLKSL